MIKSSVFDLSSVCKAGWGAHYCLLYRSAEDLISLLTQYFKFGLKNNEYCIWITPDSNAGEKAIKSLNDAMPGSYDRQKKGQLEFFDTSEWYLKGGSFHSDRVLGVWSDRLKLSTEQGYRGMRVTGDLSLLDKADWHNLMDYEMLVDQSIVHHKFMAICSYSLDNLDTNRVIDVVHHHQVTIAKNNGEWHIFQNPGRAELDLLKSFVDITDSAYSKKHIFDLPVLYPDKCNGCGLCVDACQNGLLYLTDNRISIRNGTCDWCTSCEAICSSNAIACPFEIITS